MIIPIKKILLEFTASQQYDSITANRLKASENRSKINNSIVQNGTQAKAINDRSIQTTSRKLLDSNRMVKNAQTNQEKAALSQQREQRLSQ